MKIAVSSVGQDLNAQIDPRFGRAPYFILIDIETLKYEAITNPNVNAMGGAGIQTAQLIANQGVEVIITGNCGPNAFQTLQAAGVRVITGAVGTVNDAVNQYKTGALNPANTPNVESHFGMGSGPGPQPPMGQPDANNEISVLKKEADALQQQLEMMKKRIKELENKG